ncbi:CotH protein [Roseimaritima ulvae]|uniref:CotH protein n=1 Tax=Roseimaritima ulvae TaxID=980254 RepID=A0A5B9QXS0_9BACT|nr:CotH protein [Roseimaritima ulvae]
MAVHRTYDSGWSAQVVVWLVVIGLALSTAGPSLGQDTTDAVAGQLDHRVWQLQVRLSEQAFLSLQPVAPQQGFGAPAPSPNQRSSTADRASVTNLFGVRFPWVQGTVDCTMAGETHTNIPCRIRYDGDFTYLMAAQSSKRPMFVELLQGHEIQGVRRFRLHTMQFDPTLMRERLAAHVFASLQATVTRTAHAELSLVVGDQQADLIGLYTVAEAVDEHFLTRHHIAETSLRMQTNGLGTIRFAGENWSAYAPMFRTHGVPSQQQQRRIMAFTRWISESSDREFAEQVDGFIDVESLLRYLAANCLTSNLTGMSTLGANDIFCLDAEGKFHIVAAQLETALGGAVLSGSPTQLADVRLLRPYAGECPLVDRLLAIDEHRERYLAIMGQARDGFFEPQPMATAITTIESASADARQREVAADEARRQTMAQAFGGNGPFAPPAAGATLDPRTFVAKRHQSITDQLAGTHQGFTPNLPNFGGFGGFGGIGGGGGGGRRTGAEAAITDAEFREQVRVPAGFEATLFARSPQVNYPVAIAAEPSGAIYVASDEQGSLGTDPDGGKVLRCVDDDHDGVMDRVTTFCRVDHVRGVVYRGGAVWVSHPPYLSVFHDEDGDGVADRRQQLVRGLTSEQLNTRGGDHTTNGVRMGIDGWLYIGDGDYGVPRAEGVDGSSVVLRGGGILRVRPDGTELELVSSGLRNPFDIAIDPQLNMFTRDNTNDGAGWDTRVSQLFPSAEYGYPRLFANFSDEIMPTLGTFGNGGGTGSLYIEDESWPPSHNHALFTGDWGRSAVFHHPLQADGATFQLTQQAFATIPRATGMDLDAQGNLYVASWWRGEASVHVGPHVGFVARVTPTAAEPRRLPDLAKASDAELVAALRSPNAVVRFHVQGELLRRGSHVVAALRTACLDRTLSINGRVAALFAVKQIQGAASHDFLRTLTTDPDIREFAIRALTDRKTQLDGLDADFFIPFLSDDSPRVRAQTLIALGRLGDTAAAKPILTLARQADSQRPDPAAPNAEQVIPHLALRALIELEAAEACLEALDTPQRTAALRALRSMHTPVVVDGLVTQLEREHAADQRLDLLVTLIRLYQRETPYDGSWWGIRPDTTGPFYDPQTWSQSPRIAEVLAAAIAAADPDTANRLLEELQRHQVELDGLPTPDSGVDDGANQPITIAAVDPSDPNQIGNLQYKEALTRTLAAQGEVTVGASLFRSHSCSACHTSAAGQQPVGPHLADIGKRYRSAELIESILQPSQKIAQGYETQSFLLDSGQIVSGFVTSESGKQIVVRDSRGVSHRIARDQIEQRSRRPTSAMPEGLVGSLAPRELASLIAYLQSL